MKDDLHTHSARIGFASLMTRATRGSLLAALVVAISCSACGTARGQQPREEPGGHAMDWPAPRLELPRLESFAVAEAPSLDGWWTLEIERKLDTGHADDTAFDPSRTYRMAMSVPDRTGDMDKASGVIELAFVSALPVDEIRRITGVEGTLSDGEYKIAVPQNDLDVKVDRFAIIPPMGTTSWVAFMPMGSRAMIMGDLVLLEDEFRPVQEVLIERRFQITAIHNHFLRDAPKVMFMHVGGSGEPLALARSVRAVLDKVGELRRAKGLKPQARSVASTLDGEALSRILGHAGQSSAGVYRIVAGRTSTCATWACP